MSELGAVTAGATRAEPTVPRSPKGPVGGDITPEESAKAAREFATPALGGILSSMMKGLGADDAEALGQKPTPSLDGTADAGSKIAKVLKGRSVPEVHSDNQGEHVDEDGLTSSDGGETFDFEDADGNTVQLSRDEAIQQLREIRAYEKAAAQKFTQGDRLSKSADEKLGKFVKGVSTFRDDPDSLFEHVGKDPQDYAWGKVKSDPNFMEKAAEEFQRRVEAERAEARLTPEDRRVIAAEARAEQLAGEVQQYKDRQVEAEMFSTTREAVGHAGLIPDEMVAINALEIQRAAASKGMNAKNGFGPREVGVLLRNHYLKQAENLMKGKGPVPIAETIKSAGLAPTSRARARSTPLPAKPAPVKDEEPVSSLTAMRRMYATSKASPYWKE
jgi:hypothetical protein